MSSIVSVIFVPLDDVVAIVVVLSLSLSQGIVPSLSVVMSLSLSYHGRRWRLRRCAVTLLSMSLAAVAVDMLVLDSRLHHAIAAAAVVVVVPSLCRLSLATVLSHSRLSLAPQSQSTC